jgi:hypothetical protein
MAGRIDMRLLAGGFLAGALGVLVMHQGTVWLLHMAGYVPNPPYNLRPGGALGLPLVLNAALWGGLWGILLGVLLRLAALPVLLTGFLFGAVVCTLAGWTVFPLAHGQPMFGGVVLERAWRPLLINGAYGWGAALFLRGMHLVR